MGNCFESLSRNNFINGGRSFSGTSAHNSNKSSEGTREGMAQIHSQISDATTEKSGESFTVSQAMESPILKSFSFSEMKSATRNFKIDYLLGEGGFGKVYQGWIDEESLNPRKPGAGIAVAIKKLHPDRGQGLEEWKSEVQFLGKLFHPNLVKLVGYCVDEKELLLVYEFMRRGSLENHLFRRHSAVQHLPWATRVQIAVGAARGLSYLHSLDKQIIYRDFKPSNILLDGNFNAKISDFGLATLGPTGGVSHLSTRVYGSRGYAAPEYVLTGHLYVKSDVYGYGVVLLELMTGLRALDTERPAGQESLVDWMRPILRDKRKLKAMMDKKLEGTYSTRAMKQLANIAIKCVEDEPKSRPSMAQVVDMLEHLDSV